MAMRWHRHFFVYREITWSTVNNFVVRRVWARETLRVQSRGRVPGPSEEGMPTRWDVSAFRAFNSFIPKS